MELKPATKYLVEGILYDLIPQRLGCLDFGINPQKPNPTYAALQWGLKHETFTPEELDDACGNGPKLTELVSRPGYNGENPYKCTITTMWDLLPPEDDYDDVLDDSDHLDATFKRDQELLDALDRQDPKEIADALDRHGSDCWPPK